MQATMVVVWHGTNDQYHTIAFGTFGATISSGSSWSDRLPKGKVMVVWYQGDHENHHHILRAAFYYLFWVSQVI